MPILETKDILNQKIYKRLGIDAKPDATPEEEKVSQYARKIWKGIIEDILTHIVTNNIISPESKTGDGKPVVGKII